MKIKEIQGFFSPHHTNIAAAFFFFFGFKYVYMYDTVEKESGSNKILWKGFKLETKG